MRITVVQLPSWRTMPESTVLARRATTSPSAKRHHATPRSVVYMSPASPFITPRENFVIHGTTLRRPATRMTAFALGDFARRVPPNSAPLPNPHPTERRGRAVTVRRYRAVGERLG
jgi:hypothetical protein